MKPSNQELAELLVDAIIGAAMDALDSMGDNQGRYIEDAKASRATAIEVVAKALEAREED
jgi:hypothetical protein